MLTGDPEAGHEIFVASVRSAILESHADDLVARRFRAVPRTFERYECIPTIFGWELLAVIEHHIQNGRVRLKQHVRNNGRFYFVRCSICKARLRIGPGISIRPAVEGALLHPREVVGRKIIAKPVAFLNSGVEFSGGGMEGEGGRVAHPGGKRGLAGAVRLKALN